MSLKNILDSSLNSLTTQPFIFYEIVGH